ncbi:MAG: DinB family protein [Candidatus Solibacter usitatus]|nr:DinB family protein [Candidatus Solibacter usitatus]
MPRIFAVVLFVMAPLLGQSTSVRQEILTVFDGAAKRALALAEAMPQDKFAWRPMEGVRSYGEVCMHMAGSNFLFLSYAGLKPPAGPAQELAAAYMKRGFELPELFAVEGAVKEKARIVAAMKQSFDQAREFILKMPDADFDKPVQFFDRKTTLRGILISMGGHLSEHLGQAIAYARVNHVVPPWSR